MIKMIGMFGVLDFFKYKVSDCLWIVGCIIDIVQILLGDVDDFIDEGIIL